ncbi:sporulation stage II, protein E [Aporhodopirellula aestuarii]|uniref:Sporulation stage II, protein E n=1 Tax=Aporhodopirellula aestuarii TaxID=2950107 RepID=A0ABT0U9B1_9BACT|nr:sporulation stage II, protein E [Aporhodopirellula aestuarii]MCM2373473.1 sporulation stage II, protein E [Aporhodopirellula aestuarii]
MSCLTRPTCIRHGRVECLDSTLGSLLSSSIQVEDNVSTPPPSYLKLHLSDRDSDAGTAGSATAPVRIEIEDRDSGRTVEGFWRTYTETTGWRIDAAPNTRDAQATVSEDRPPVLTAGDAQRLADAARAMAEEMQQQKAILRSQQAELAARAAVILDVAKAENGCDQIDRILADAALATGTDAAVVYLLDEETERLSTRFVFGLSAAQRIGTSRPLRGARGDLEAMIQGVVAIEDLQGGPINQYTPPEPFASGICVSLGGVELPIGTMWLFSRTVQKYNDCATASARLASSNVCNILSSMSHVTASPNRVQLNVAEPVETNFVDEELERMLAIDFNDADLDVDSDLDAEFDADRFVAAMDPLPSQPQLVETAVPPTIRSWTNQVSDWQHDTLPIGVRLAPSWSVDGLVESPLDVAQSWHHWDVLPDGVIALSMCQFGAGWDPSCNLVNTLDGAVARAALQAHASYRHTPHDAIMRTLHTLLQVRDAAIDETGCPNLSLLYAHIDPETGHARMSSVGQWSSLIVSKYGYRPVNIGRPAKVRADEFMGEQTAMNHETTLLNGEVLLIGGADWMGVAEDVAETSLPPNESAQNRIGSAIKEALREGERSPLSALRRFTASLPLRRERTAIALMHEGV